MGKTPMVWSSLDSVHRLKLHQGPPPEDSTTLPFVYISLREQIDAEANYNVESFIDQASVKLLEKAHEFVEGDIHIYNLKCREHPPS